ncbi:MAG: PQQ-binding-like beta-propeller repeat protein [Paucibacter sp.]|nr:PQQ-binding-like beta-propeller repeat protein [Roseateles sp.]
MYQHIDRPLRAWAMAALLGLTATGAAATDISSSPLIVASPSSVKANMLFVLDDSGSMDWDFMPDHVHNREGNVAKYCRSAGATGTGSGSFSGACCTNNSSATSTCWTDNSATRRAQPPFMSNSLNGVAYNPATLYLPPVNAAGVTQKSMTSANTTTWTKVPIDAYGVQSTETTNLVTGYPDTMWCNDNDPNLCARNGNYVLPGSVGGTSYTVFTATTASGSGKLAIGSPESATLQANTDFGPHYYKINPGEYCDAPNLRNCTLSGSATGIYTHPAPIRWCNSDTNARAKNPPAGACQAVRTTSGPTIYSSIRFPTKFMSAAVGGTAEVPEKRSTVTITFGTPKKSSSSNNSCSLALNSLVVNGANILAAPGSNTSSSTTLASNVAAQIEAAKASTRYSATASNSSITITAPVDVINRPTVTITDNNSNCMTVISPTTPQFSAYVAYKAAVPDTAAAYPGSFERVDIVASRTSYPKVAARTDCSGATCSHAEEMTNFANWFAYYRTRMQSMKSSATRAFAPVANNRRVGFMSLNNNTGSDFLNLDTFEDKTTAPASTHKTQWFTKLLAASPSNSTPLRGALATAGRLYGGKYNGDSINGVSVTDPMQYSCQRNFTILSTDGYWNGSAPNQLDGTTDIGDQDGELTGAKLDGDKTPNTLADVAAYYFATDLRTGKTGDAECNSNKTGGDVCGNGSDSPLQNMRTFTLGLGAAGFMQFSAGAYTDDTNPDFNAVKNATTANPSAGVCGWQSSGACRWPLPEGDKLTTIDDLWHAAVNGDGTYFSASDPTSLYTGLSEALAAIDVQTKAAAAATTSNPNVSSGEDEVFVSNFNSGEWSGDLQSQHINTTTGVVDGSKFDWSARTLLDGRTSPRTIYLFNSGGTKNRKSFDWDSLDSTEKSYFETSHITASGRALSQFCGFGAYCLSGASQSAAAGKALVNFIRGDQSNEGILSEANKFYRKRVHLLGDIVNSEAVYVAKSGFEYIDTGFADHKAIVDKRQGMVYVGANDGMLHAFSAETGEELWAFVPTPVLPNLYRLADKSYPTQHEFYVDGTPTVQEIYDGAKWRTLLVGGLGAGGRGYYALDVTDPSSPEMLWEFTSTEDSRLGYTLGKAEIGKLKDGTWAVFFGSGYNNDDSGSLFILNAGTGALIRNIAASGSTGLGHIRGWVDNGDADNTIQRVYGGDELGNVWRFDVNNISGLGAAGYDAQLLATLKAPNGSAQPVTSRPELGQVGVTVMVYVGTGRYLGTSDLSSSQVQSIYAIKDRMGSDSWGDPRDPLNKFVQQTLADSTCPTNSSICTAGATVRTNVAPKPVNLSSDGGWFVDLPKSKERVNTDPQLALGTLVVNSNVIDASGDVCKVGGSSFANFLDYRTGAPVSSANGVASVSLGQALATRPALVKLPNNKVISISRLSDNRTVSTPVPVDLTAGPTRRLSWRDLIQD